MTVARTDAHPSLAVRLLDALRATDLADAALAALFVLVGVVGTVQADRNGHGDRPLDAFGFVLVVGTALTVSVRRRRPLHALLVAAVLTATYLAMGYAYGPILFPFLVCVYSVPRYRPVKEAAWGAAVSLGLLLVHLVTSDQALPGLVGVVPASAWVVVPFAIGATVRSTRASAEQSRAEALRRRVDDERLRMAQEVHDVVGHGLAAISMQANVALHVLPKDPTQAEKALEAISRTSTQALEELRATLTTARRTEVEAPRAVGPDLTQVEELCGRMRAAGAHIDLWVEGTPRRVPPAVGLAGYRLVQESLTNVLRHGPVPRADVRIGYADQGVTILVSNPAPDAVVRTGGLGLPGMRERVESLGGSFRAGPVPTGEFEVWAEIPTPAASASKEPT